MTLLQAREISVRLGGRPVLTDVSALFKPGSVTAIIGPNGAGKSTLLAALAGLRAPDSGQVLLGDTGVQTLPARDRARRIGFLPQIAEVAWALDVRTLVSLGLIPFGSRTGSQDDAAIDFAMETTGVSAFADRRIDTLSGGERSRVLLARALVGDPEWLLADEPLAGLDPGHVLDACEILVRRARSNGKGVVLTLHDLTTAARVADQIIVLAEGRIMAHAEPLTALTPTVLAKAYGVDATVSAGGAGPHIDITGRTMRQPPEDFFAN